MHCFPIRGRRLAATGPLVALLLAGCTDATAPVAAPTSPLAPEQSARRLIVDETRPFYTTADTTILDSWSTSSTCNNEIRANAIDGNGNAVSYRGVYFKVDQCGASENAGLIEFRPHENTLEHVAIELYDKNYFGIMKRGMSKSWYYYQNNLGQQDDLDFWAQATLRWTPVAYAIASRTASPSSIIMDAGTSATVVSHAFASNGTEIYNQSTSSWSSTNSGVAYPSSTSGTQTVSSHGVPWYNWTNTVVATATPGTATVNFSIGGANVAIPVTVTPTGSVSGNTWITINSSNTFTASAGNCGSGCSIHAERVLNDGTLWDLGTTQGTAASYSLGWTGMGTSELYVYITANGATKTIYTTVYEQTDGGGGGSCAPNVIIC